MRELVVIGNGMVGHRLLTQLVERGLPRTWRITVFAEEPRLAYDRVNLSSFFTGRTADQLSLLPEPGWYEANGIAAFRGDRAVEISREARQVRTASGLKLSYDRLVLATGSYPFVPPLPGRDAPGCFVYRTIEDLEAIRAYAAGRKTGIVIGGGLLGLEAANALKSLGLATHVV